jgi:O-antigen/teichoic acid export membrane protein
MWAVIDQAAFALSNFLISLLLARWLTLEEYGAFAVSLTVFFLLGNIHAGLFIEPMLVFGPSKYRDCVPAYISILRNGHWVVSTLASLLFMLAGMVAWFWGMTVMASSLWGVGIGAPFILFLWLMRRSCYIKLEPHRAAQAGIWYLVIMTLGVFVLNQVQALSVFSALLVIGLASLVAGWSISRKLKSTTTPAELHELKASVRTAHREYGAWACSTNIMMWIPGNLYILFLPLWLGLEAAGALKALLSLIMPALQAFAAIGTILVPTLVTVRNQTVYSRTLYTALAVLGTASLVQWLLLSSFGKPLMTWVYAGKYDAYADLLWLLGLLPVMTSIVTIFASSLRARERPDRTFWAYVCSSTFTISIGLIMLVFWGIMGAVIGLVLSYGVTAIVLWWFHLALESPAAHSKLRTALEPNHAMGS